MAPPLTGKALPVLHNSVLHHALGPHAPRKTGLREIKPFQLETEPERTWPGGLTPRTSNPEAVSPRLCSAGVRLVPNTAAFARTTGTHALHLQAPFQTQISSTFPVTLLRILEPVVSHGGRFPSNHMLLFRHRWSTWGQLRCGLRREGWPQADVW